MSILLVFPLIMAQIAQPLLIRQIVLCIEDQSGLPSYAGYLCGLALFTSCIVQAIVSEQIFFRNGRAGMRIRNSLSSAIYKHLLTTNTATLHKTTAAQMINLVANDASKFEELSMFIHTPLLATVEALAAFGLIFWHIGLPTIFGYAVLVLLIPIQFIFSRQFSRYQNVKMYNWEKAMEQRVREARQRELSNIYKVSCLRALNVAFAFTSLPLISLATFGGSWLLGQTLLPENIFTTVGFFVMVRVPVTIWLPSAIEKFSEARVSARRIDQFMQLDTLSNKREKIENENEAHAIVMEDTSFSWKNTPSLFSLNLKIRNGNLVGIKGSIGAGKSTLLAAILNEINLVSGKLQLHVRSISYAPQSAWIFADTIRANILLGEAMNDERYKNVIKACCLDIDLENFGEVGDLLIIGDKGVSLSDVLLLRGKTRILVTHQTHFLVETDQIYLMTNGQIEELQIEQIPTMELSSDTSETESSDNKETDWVPNSAIADMNSIIKNETSVEGAIKWSVWLKLFTAPPLRWFGLFLMIIFMLINEAVYDFSNVWLAMWSDKDYSEQRLSFYAYIYLGAVSSILIVAIIRVGFGFYIMLRGSTYLHNRMLTGMLYTSLRFFESNPSGRILNRASKDQQILDQSLPVALIDTMQYLLMIIVLWLRRFYMRSSRQLKRLESVTRSPIYTLFSSSFDGLTSIRAFNVQDDFLNMFMDRIDTNSRAYFILYTSAYWFGLRLDVLVSFLTLITALLAVFFRHQILPSAAALSFIYCISLTGLFPWAMRQSAEAENSMTSAERIYEYSQLVSESQQNSNKNNVLIQPAEDWPSHGIIEFKDYTFRYRPELDSVLKNINLRIESKEKIGVIGRTGAGKPSLLQALFRLVDQSAINGTILIDNIDIGRLSLHHLRSHLNEECLTALEAVQLRQLVRNHPDGIHLLVAESGVNLSAGERQLICVARAILKKSRILLIDEATANVDHATDTMIQEVISDKFRHCTILTIAHRLNTVANSDRILMLQQGQVVYFDTPSNIHLT
ncbi:unnamed protein product [Adineta steineri]|uniref:Uncharacterized protein n=3 Tax=Adineta steineri TaxID=433720 RepID=A0A819QN46_9BILA|nr:unnamed protein product [Adineta steineri]